jgi:tellurium resistance protein TerZ
MSINLAKGQKISLAKEVSQGLSRVIMGLGWDAKQAKGFFGKLLAGGERQIDLDASCLLFDSANNLVDTVWFRQLKSKDGSIVHTGDNLTGAGEGDDEQIIVNLTSVPANINSLIFVVNSFSGHRFDEIENAFCRLVDAARDQEVAKYQLSCTGNHSAMIMARLYRDQTGGDWHFQALGETGAGQTFHDLLPAIKHHLN